MIGSESDTPFDELPEALVEEMLGSCDKIATDLSKHFKEIIVKKKEHREVLQERGVLRNKDELPTTPTYPTSCGVDGSYSIEKLISTDISAAASVAIEGLTPPGPEKRHWPKPRHFAHVDITKHSEATSSVLRGITMNLELTLASQAPHDVVFLDGSMTTPFIYIHQAAQKLDEVSENLQRVFREGKEQKNEDGINFPGLKDSFVAYEKILSASRSDKIYAAIPKYSTENKVCELLDLPEYEDRGLLNFILDKGEFVGPIELEKEFHFKNPPEEIRELKDRVINSLKRLQVVYFRPSEFFPVIRLEIAPSIGQNNHRLAILFEALEIQCVAPGIMEPYPLYLADRMVKHLGTALPAIRKTATQEMALKWEDKEGSMYLAMHGYRTERGK